MTILEILKLVNDCKIKENDYFYSTNNHYDDLIYQNNELYQYDKEYDETRVLTFSDIAELVDENIQYNRKG